MKKLTQKQQLFADLYDGNGTDACRKAGYKGGDNVMAQQARNLLRNAQVVEVIETRHLEVHGGDIADREARQLFWSTVMMNSDEPMQARLKASEILGRSCGDFIAKIESTQEITFKSFLDSLNAGSEPLVTEDNDD